MLSPFAVFVLLIVVFALIFVGMAVKSVPQGYEWTVERFGRYVRTLEPGLALIIPIVDRVGARLNMMETVLEVPQQSVITRDNAVVAVDAIVFYQVLDAGQGSLRGGQSAARDNESCNHQHSHRNGVDDPRRTPL
jgi:regulator of protease activity HflC (stomatin/prohibitin superfamily)